MNRCAVFMTPVVALLLSAAVFAEDSRATRLSLKGLPGVGLRVQPLGAAATEGVLSTDRLDAAIQNRLRAANIRVLSAEEQRRVPGRPALNVQVALLPLDEGEYLYSVHVDLMQWVALLGNPHATLETAIAVPATTWSADYRFGIAPKTAIGADVLSAVESMIDAFVEAYVRVNPQRKTAL